MVDNHKVVQSVRQLFDNFVFCVYTIFKHATINSLEGHEVGFCRSISSSTNPQNSYSSSLVYLKQNRSTELPLVMLVWTADNVSDSNLDLYKDNRFYGISPDKVSRERLLGNVMRLLLLFKWENGRGKNIKCLQGITMITIIYSNLILYLT